MLPYDIRNRLKSSNKEFVKKIEKLYEYYNNFYSDIMSYFKNKINYFKNSNILYNYINELKKLKLIVYYNKNNEQIYNVKFNKKLFDILYNDKIISPIYKEYINYIDLIIKKINEIDTTKIKQKYLSLEKELLKYFRKESNETLKIKWRLVTEDFNEYAINQLNELLNYYKNKYISEINKIYNNILNSYKGNIIKDIDKIIKNIKLNNYEIKLTIAKYYNIDIEKPDITIKLELSNNLNIDNNINILKYLLFGTSILNLFQKNN